MLSPMGEGGKTMRKDSLTAKRFVAALLFVCIAATILLSVGFIISHADHHCTGEGCSVCAHIGDCIHSLNNLAGLCLILGAAFAFSGLLPLMCSETEHFSRRKITLVQLKVQMNN